MTGQQRPSTWDVIGRDGLRSIGRDGVRSNRMLGRDTLLWPQDAPVNQNQWKSAIWELRWHVNVDLRWGTSAVWTIMVLLAMSVTSVNKVIILFPTGDSWAC